MIAANRTPIPRFPAIRPSAIRPVNRRRTVSLFWALSVIRALSTLTLLALAPTLTRAQDGTPLDWGALFHVVDISAWQGHRFQVSAAVRTIQLDHDAGAEIWVRIDKSDKKMGFFNNMMDKPIRDSQWKVVRIAGKVDKDAKWLNFGALYQHKGYFFFDDFHLTVEMTHGRWQEISFPDAGFETDTATFNKNWIYLRRRTFFFPRIVDSIAYEGRQCVMIDGSRFTLQSTYGNNDSTGHYMNANGIKLYYEIYGHGHPLLLLHGNSESIVSFRKQIPELSKYYQVIAVDTRGQGKSGEDGKTYTYDLFAADMKAFLDSLHLDSVDVLGWSDGGNTGLIMAMDYPSKVRRLATMGANIFIDHTVVDDSVFHMIRKLQRGLKGDTTWQSVNRNRLLTLLLTEPRHNFAQLQSIQCPVLVMAGEKDLISDVHTRGIAYHIPHSQLVIFPGGTHEEPDEHPDLFNKTVLDFLAAPAL